MKLTDLVLRKQSLPVGRHNDTPSLYLDVRKGGTQNFLFLRFLKVAGKRKQVTMGVGGYPAVSLSEARQRAADLYEMSETSEVTARVGNGESFSKVIRDIEARDERAQAKAYADAKRLTFGAFAETYVAETVARKNTNQKAVDQWMNSIKQHTPELLPLPVAEIDVEDVYGAVKDVWYSHNATAVKILQRVHKILGAARALGHRSGDNPAAYRGNLENLLPSQKRRVEHHAAMSWTEVPDFYQYLTGLGSVSAACLRFIILTASRSTQGRGAKFDEIDVETGIWTVPADRMKARKTHYVPLSSEALTIVREMRVLQAGDHLFKAPETSTQHVSEAAVYKVLKKAGVFETAKLHGFRSTFRDWAGEKTDFPEELAKAALAHQGSTLDQAYRRQQAIERRRPLMQEWSDYLARERSVTVVPIAR
jgi:integrase